MLSLMLQKFKIPKVECGYRITQVAYYLSPSHRCPLPVPGLQVFAAHFDLCSRSQGRRSPLPKCYRPLPSRDELHQFIQVMQARACHNKSPACNKTQACHLCFLNEFFV